MRAKAPTGHGDELSADTYSRRPAGPSKNAPVPMNDPKIHPDKAVTDVNDDTHHDIMYPSSIAFILVHLSCLGAIWSGITWQAIVICVVLYWARIFAIGAGYHRYFSHRAYSTAARSSSCSP
jgi:hypothetical protein